VDIYIYLLIIFFMLDSLIVPATACYILRVHRISDRQVSAQFTGRNPVILLTTKHEPHPHRPVLQVEASAGHCVQAVPVLYMVPPIQLPPGP